MNYATIKNCDIANGEGVRVSLFVSGCRNHCPGCFQPETWDFGFGEEFTPQVEDKIIESLSPEYVDGLTLLGGEPMEKANQRSLLPFVKRVKETYPHKNIWCYTGYTLETDLLHGLGMGIDNGEARGYPFSFCASVGRLFTSLPPRRGSIIITARPFEWA